MKALTKIIFLLIVSVVMSNVCFAQKKSKLSTQKFYNYATAKTGERVKVTYTLNHYGYWHERNSSGDKLYVKFKWTFSDFQVDKVGFVKGINFTSISGKGCYDIDRSFFINYYKDSYSLHKEFFICYGHTKGSKPHWNAEIVFYD